MEDFIIKNKKLIYDFYENGLKNENYLKKNDLKNKFKIFLYPLIALITTKNNFQNSDVENIKIIYSEHHEKILTDVKGEKYYWGKLSLNHINLISNLKFVERIIFLKDIIKFIFCMPKKNLFYWSPEFLIILNFLKNNQNKNVIIAGHFDRIATWISEIKNEYHYNFEIYQHGVVSNINIPVKINADEVNVFFENEAKFFKDNIIKNRDTKYNTIEFKSNVIFQKNVENTFKIGIASQKGYTEKTIELAKKMNKNKQENIRIYVYPHPQEKIEEYEEKLKNDKQIIISEIKISNLDILITYYSTIIYDYLTNSEFKGEIISFPLNYKYELSFFKNPRVQKVLSEDDILKIIENKLLNSEKK